MYGGGCTGHKIMHNDPKGRRAGVPLSLIPLFFVGSAAFIMAFMAMVNVNAHHIW